jgi:hypothetical protein
MDKKLPPNYSQKYRSEQNPALFQMNIFVANLCFTRIYFLSVKT